MLPPNRSDFKMSSVSMRLSRRQRDSCGSVPPSLRPEGFQAMRLIAQRVNKWCSGAF